MRVGLPVRPTGAPVEWEPPGAVVAEAQDVYVRLGTAEVLKGVTLPLVSGRIVALAGPNGAGKSTLLGVIAGDIRPDRGSVQIGGKAPEQWRLSELALARTLLPQKPSVSFGFTVRCVVEMARAPWLNTPDSVHDESIVAAAMSETDISGFAERRFRSLSGGEQARASVARVLAQNTQILLLDEPTAALDVHHTEVVFEALHRRADAGCAVVVVVHDLQLAAAHADEVVLLSKGKVAAAGPPVDVLTPEILSRVYGHEIEVVTHLGIPLAVPRRSPSAAFPPTR